MLEAQNFWRTVDTASQNSTSIATEDLEAGQNWIAKLHISCHFKGPPFLCRTGKKTNLPFHSSKWLLASWEHGISNNLIEYWHRLYSNAIIVILWVAPAKRITHKTNISMNQVVVKFTGKTVDFDQLNVNNNRYPEPIVTPNNQFLHHTVIRGLQSYGILSTLIDVLKR